MKLLSAGTIFALFVLTAASPVAVDEHEARDANADANADAGLNMGLEYVHLDSRRNFQGTANPKLAGSGVTLKCRTGPSTSQGERTSYKQGATLNIKCQTLGDNVEGNAIWNKIDRSWARDCYVADYYTKTGYKWIPGVPRC